MGGGGSLPLCSSENPRFLQRSDDADVNNHKEDDEDDYREDDDYPAEI